MALNVSPFGNRVRAHEIVRGEAEAEATTAMQRGTRLEGLARVAYQRAVGRAVAECGAYVSEKTPFLLASPDGVVVNTDGVHEGFVELKVTGSGEPAPITDSYLLQCVMHCYCGELLYCDFVSFGRDKLLVQRVTYDSEAFEEDVLPMLDEFMSRMDSETIPNLLPGQDQAFLRQVLKDYRNQHVTSVRLYTHELNVT